MKKVLLFIAIVNFCNAQSYKQEIVGGVTETTEGLRVELKNPIPSQTYNAAIRAYNNNNSNGSGILAGSASQYGSGVHSASTLGYGVTGLTGAFSIFSAYFPNTGTTTNSGILGLGKDSYIGVKGYSDNGIGGFFASNNGNIPLVVKKIPNLAAGITNSIFFQTGDKYTGAIKTIGISPDFARLGFFTFASPLENDLAERMSIADDGNVGIGNITPNAKLDVVGVSAGGTAAFKGSSWYSHFNYSSTEDTYIRGGKAGSKVIINDLAGLGNVGIGHATPNELLDVNGRVRIRHNVNTSGIWMSNSANSLSSVDGAFYGMKTDAETGIYIGNAWRFWVNSAGVSNSTGGISVGGGETISKIIKTTVNYDLPSIAQGSNIEVDFVVNGASDGDVAIVNGNGITGSIIMSNVRVYQANKVSVSFYNSSAFGAIDLSARDFRIVVFK